MQQCDKNTQQVQWLFLPAAKIKFHKNPMIEADEKKFCKLVQELKTSNFPFEHVQGAYYKKGCGLAAFQVVLIMEHALSFRLQILTTIFTMSMNEQPWKRETFWKLASKVFDDKVQISGPGINQNAQKQT